MELLECTKEEFDYYKETFLTLSTWNPIFEFESLSILKKIEVNGEIVALLEFSGSMYGEHSIEIDNFEVFEKGKGIGSKVVDGIKEYFTGYELYLYSSSPESDAFWKKHGFKSLDDGTGTGILRFSKDEDEQPS
ncbi:GNAT family N-acetyltransferase [Bacillus infantis]|uniref:GNAT family N-acetyltransferase n=1 Tax=Bacillus infantis TaxID=324767 RepID=UPI00209EAFB7|nr:GNAT family N-acetyltransferase [Bacillus infantis]MCP1161361.1 GNAT family N-acetyltransferase [Bacillus infantis]